MNPIEINSKRFGLLSWFRLWWSDTGLLSRYPQKDIISTPCYFFYCILILFFTTLLPLAKSLLKQAVPNYLYRFATDFVILLPSHSWPCMVLLMQSPRCWCPCKTLIPERSQIISSSHLWTLVTSPLTTHGIQPSLIVLAVTSVCFLHYYQWHLEISHVVMVSHPVVFHTLFN